MIFNPVDFFDAPHRETIPAATLAMSIKPRKTSNARIYLVCALEALAQHNLSTFPHATSNALRQHLRCLSAPLHPPEAFALNSIAPRSRVLASAKNFFCDVACSRGRAYNHSIAAVISLGLHVTAWARGICFTCS